MTERKANRLDSSRRFSGRLRPAVARNGVLSHVRLRQRFCTRRVSEPRPDCRSLRTGQQSNEVLASLCPGPGPGYLICGGDIDNLKPESIQVCRVWEGASSSGRICVGSPDIAKGSFNRYQVCRCQVSSCHRDRGEILRSMTVERAASSQGSKRLRTTYERLEVPTLDPLGTAVHAVSVCV